MKEVLLPKKCQEKRLDFPVTEGAEENSMTGISGEQRQTDPGIDRSRAPRLAAEAAPEPSGSSHSGGSSSGRVSEATGTQHLSATVMEEDAGGHLVCISEGMGKEGLVCPESKLQSMGVVSTYRPQQATDRLLRGKFH